MVAWYAEHGYHFLSLSDHYVLMVAPAGAAVTSRSGWILGCAGILGAVGAVGALYQALAARRDVRYWSAQGSEEPGFWTATLLSGEEGSMGRRGGPGGRGYPAEFRQRVVDLLATGRVEAEGQFVTHAGTTFGLSRPAFYAARAALSRGGLPALVRQLRRASSSRLRRCTLACGPVLSSRQLRNTSM